MLRLGFRVFSRTETTTHKQPKMGVFPRRTIIQKLEAIKIKYHIEEPMAPMVLQYDKQYFL